MQFWLPNTNLARDVKPTAIPSPVHGCESQCYVATFSGLSLPTFHCNNITIAMSGVSKLTADRNQRVLQDLLTKPGNGEISKHRIFFRFSLTSIVRHLRGL